MRIESLNDLKIVNEEIEKVIKSQSLLSQEITNLASNMLQKMKENEAIFDNYQELNKADSERLTGQFLNYDRSVRIRLSKLYETLVNQIVTPSDDFDESLRYYFNEIKEVDNIEVFDENEVIYFTIPMILPKTIRVNKADNRNRYPIQYDKFYANEISNIMASNYIEHTSKIWSLGSKVIHFVFAYESNFNYIADSDSHDTKSIIDAICKELRFGDSGITTSIIYETMTISDQNNQTYIAVYDRKSEIKTAESIVANIQKLRELRIAAEQNR